MSFYLNYTPPTLNKNLKLKELSFLQYRTLNKFIINNNNSHICDYFDSILQECLLEANVFNKLTNFDKFCALFLLRCTCVSPEIEFINNTAKAKASLLPLLQKCLDLKTEFSRVVKVDENIELELTLPKVLYFETLFDGLYESVSEVFFKGDKINYDNKKELVETLPAEVLNTLKQFSGDITEAFKPIVLNIGIKEKDQFSLSPYNLSLLEILKALYTANLKSILELQYVLVSKCRYNPDFIDKNTLTENLILANIYEDEVKRINEEQSKSFENPVAGNK
jgi:hypothetical protein